MTRLKKGDICPLCGERINTSDPFTLGYLSAWADLTSSPETDPPTDDSGEPFPLAYAVTCGTVNPEHGRSDIPVNRGYVGYDGGRK